MPATKEDIRQWLKDAPKHATHMIVVCDTYDWDDYPVYVNQYQNVHEVVSSKDGVNMAKVMEVYNLSMDIEKQLANVGHVMNY